jgi:hypothetical protein
MNELLCAGTSESDWRQIQPVLDDAMHELSETDRAAVVLRFFEGQNLKEIGLALGLKENAARMRVDRALEKLQTLLAKRGIKSTAGGLAAAIAAGAVVSAPTGLAAGVATGALTLTASTASTAFTAIKLMTMTKLKVGLISAVVVAGVATQYRTQVGLREENQSLRKQAVQMARIAEENRRLAAMVAQADGSQSLSKDQLSELMKLRGEVGLLRKQNGELEKLREENRRALASPNSPGQGSDPGKSYTVDEYQKEAGIAKLNYAKYCVLALQLYAEKNQGWFPASFDQALAYLPEEARTEMNLAPNEFLPYTPKFGLTPDRFELVYAGALADIATPASVIVFREREAWGENGRWNRTYGFADGHSEIHFSPDGNFDAWEKQHRTAPAPPGP